MSASHITSSILEEMDMARKLYIKETEDERTMRPNLKKQARNPTGFRRWDEWHW